MKKYFISADIHSFYSVWKATLDDSGFDVDDDSHILVVLGDLFDRGPESVECLDFVTSLPKERTILIRGNHEDLLWELLNHEREPMSHDVHNGTLRTIDTLCGGCAPYDVEIELVMQNPKVRDYFSRLVYWFAPDDKNVFCHGWLPINDYTLDEEELLACDGKEVYIPNNWKTLPEHRWRIAAWYNGMDTWNKGAKLDGVTIWCGHWHTSWGHSKLHKLGTEWGDDACFDPFIDEGIVALDGCTAYSHQVNVVTLEV